MNFHAPKICHRSHAGNPAASLCLFMNAKDITVPEGHEVTVNTNSDFQISRSRVDEHRCAEAEEDGISDALLVTKVRHHPGITRSARTICST